MVHSQPVQLLFVNKSVQLSYSISILLCACVHLCVHVFVTKYDHCGVLGTVDEICPCTYSQAHGTPFTISPLSTDLGFCGDLQDTEDVPRRQYDGTSFQESVRLLLEHLKQVDEVAQTPTHPTISEAEFIGKLKVWNENTTSSPSGLHLGHYKALIARHKYSDDEDEDFDKRAEWNHMQQELLTLHVTLLNYALERGYSYSRWQSIINMILFKDEDKVKIHRTGVIHIYEADYNLMLGLKWRVALYQAEALQLLNQGQYGSRPRRNAVDPVMIEELQFEISRLLRRMLLQTNYDVTACYDRIIPNLVVLVSQKFGVHPNVLAYANARTLQNAKHKVRTELGISETSYGHSEEEPIYGSGQGSGNASQIWGFQSSVLFDIYDTPRATPAVYCNPDHSNQFNVAMIGFVDDINGQTNMFFAVQDKSTL